MAKQTSYQTRPEMETSSRKANKKTNVNIGHAMRTTFLSKTATLVNRKMSTRNCVFKCVVDKLSKISSLITNTAKRVMSSASAIVGYCAAMMTLPVRLPDCNLVTLR